MELVLVVEPVREVESLPQSVEQRGQLPQSSLGLPALVEQAVQAVLPEQVQDAEEAMHVVQDVFGVVPPYVA